MHNLGLIAQCSAWDPYGSHVVAAHEVEANWGFPGDAEFPKDFHEMVSNRVPVNPMFCATFAIDCRREVSPRGTGCHFVDLSGPEIFAGVGIWGRRSRAMGVHNRADRGIPWETPIRFCLVSCYNGATIWVPGGALRNYPEIVCVYEQRRPRRRKLLSVLSPFPCVRLLLCL
jgi:hypothetical protein